MATTRPEFLKISLILIFSSINIVSKAHSMLQHIYEYQFKCFVIKIYYLGGGHLGFCDDFDDFNWNQA